MLTICVLSMVSLTLERVQMQSSSYYTVSCNLRWQNGVIVDDTMSLFIENLYNQQKNRSVTYECICHFINIDNKEDNLLCNDKEEMLFEQSEIKMGFNDEVVKIYDAVVSNTPSSHLSSVNAEVLKNIYLHDKNNRGLQSYRRLPIYL